MNLSRYQSSGQLVYIDCLSRLLDGIWAEPGDALVATPPNKSPSTVTYSLDRLELAAISQFSHSIQSIFFKPLLVRLQHNTEYTISVVTSKPVLCFDSDGTLRGLYDEIQSLLTCGRTQKPVCIVLDDLSILTSVGVRVRDITSFVRYCSDLISGPQCIANVR